LSSDLSATLSLSKLPAGDLVRYELRRLPAYGA
jgi:hypothetical protein